MTLFDPFRKVWVAATPEERVRQGLLQNMVQNLDYPWELMVVECSLKALPSIPTVKGLPSRRIDILCYGRDFHPHHALYPLIVIECKAQSISAFSLRQIKGYNYYIGAPFVAVQGKEAFLLGAGSQGMSQTFLPPYHHLIEAAKRFFNERPI